MKTVILFSVISLVFFTFSCSNSQKGNKDVVTSDTSNISFSRVFEKQIDSFSMLLATYKDLNDVSPIGYVLIESMENDSIFKIRMESLTNEKLLRNATYDTYFKRKNVHFLVNYNLSNLINLKTKSPQQNIIEQSKIIKYQAADTKFPTWLILMSKEKVIKINKNASSKFSAFKDIFAEFTDTGVRNYEQDEWGDRVIKPKQ